jgi:hypothetical protein
LQVPVPAHKRHDFPLELLDDVVVFERDELLEGEEELDEEELFRSASFII